MFRFDAANHEYIDVHAGEVLPHITGMLLDGGLIDDTWFTEESCIRGTEVHRMTADWDLRAIDDLASVVTRYKGYLCAHVRAVEIIRPRFDKVESYHRVRQPPQAVICRPHFREHRMQHGVNDLIGAA